MQTQRSNSTSQKRRSGPILGLSDQSQMLDLDYFTQLIEHHQTKASYMENLAIQSQQSGFGKLNAEEQLKNALDEINKAEKDIKMIATIAQTLIEKSMNSQKHIATLEDQANSAHV